MIKQLLAVGVSAAALALSIPAAAQDEMEEKIPTPEMHFGTWGVDPDALDPAVDPGDDFFAYVNGKWIADNPIPPEYARFGAFNILREKSTADVDALVDELLAANPAPGTQERRIVDAYNAYMDTNAINSAGLAPAKPYLNEIMAAQDLSALIDVMGEPGEPALVSGSVTVDSKDPDSYIVSIGFNGMGLPDRDYYLVDNERNQEIRKAYKGYLAFLLGKAGYAAPEQAAEAVYSFEHSVAMLEWDRTALRNRDLTYNKLSRAELQALAPDFPLDEMLASQGYGDQQTFLASQLPPTAEESAGLDAAMLNGIGGGLPAMMKLVDTVPLATLKAYMAAQFLSNNASVLPSDIDQAHFNLYGKLLNGQEEQRPRWKRAIAATESELGEVLGKIYVDRYFPPENKAAMDDLVENLRQALAVSIAENDWMGDQTKKEAEAKLNAFTPKIGYPDEFKTYEGLTISADTPLANRVAAMDWQHDYDLSRLGQPVDRREWFMLPQTVNAYYNPVMNEIVFPAAILQPPFFNETADPAVNYGAIGGVIGHEMGHGFDDQGAKSDGTGMLRNWWTPQDKAKFEELTGKLVAQYNQFCPYDDGKTCVNGAFTLGENIGDLGGLSLAYRAYKMSLDGKEAPVIDGLTGDQRFFLAWAQVWRSTQRDAAGRQRLMTDPHSPEEFRTNGIVRNMDAWYDAFDVTPEDDLYLPPEQRVTIW
ncbi:M13 family metallopeptidase [Altericroceibacterium endophyticum]|uniref:M13 family peptidase n=1 Tax=Altericroceibacterium endophyticum TaxID=1808508 RepID=A0A6I4T3H7_9SPHN|nr:M13 family metallopeptidase [Altericroceibacterium endophyticum]MXO65824.1 M13 family peptidase [Altericroceibacterium endophyticum]